MGICGDRMGEGEMTPQEALNFLYEEALNSHHYGLNKIIEARKVLQATITMAQHPDRTQFDARGDTGREGEKK